MKVILLEKTPNLKDVIYAACRQCYFEDWIGNEWLNNNISNHSDDDKNRLITHVFNSGHHTTLEHASFTFSISGISRSLSHQLVRHRIATFSQQSQRYAGKGKSHYIIPPKIEKNNECLNKFNELLDHINETYSYLVDNNILEEDARYVLPNACSTNIVMTMNVRALIHFLEERLCSCAQWEIRNLARKIHEICKNEFPIIFNNIGPKCYTLGYCNESSKRSCGLKPLKRNFLKE